MLLLDESIVWSCRVILTVTLPITTGSRLSLKCLPTWKFTVLLDVCVTVFGGGGKGAEKLTQGLVENELLKNQDC
jgi:hypothetical protein